MQSDDETRVILPISDDAAEDEDYINANYIVVRANFFTSPAVVTSPALAATKYCNQFVPSRYNVHNVHNFIGACFRNSLTGAFSSNSNNGKMPPHLKQFATLSYEY